MKIEGPGRTGGTKGASKTGSAKKSGDASFESLVGEEASVDLAKPLAGSASIGQLGALLSLQEVDDASGDSRRKAKKRADLILEQLEKVKLALLTGGLSVSMLEDLSRTIKVQKENINDPLLTEIIDEIDMRAQIELAKYQS